VGPKGPKCLVLRERGGALALGGDGGIGGKWWLFLGEFLLLLSKGWHSKGDLVGRPGGGGQKKRWKLLFH
jgi:hypothetical protein